MDLPTPQSHHDRSHIHTANTVHILASIQKSNDHAHITLSTCPRHCIPHCKRIVIVSIIVSIIVFIIVVVVTALNLLWLLLLTLFDLLLLILVLLLELLVLLLEWQDLLLKLRYLLQRLLEELVLLLSLHRLIELIAFDVLAAMREEGEWTKGEPIVELYCDARSMRRASKC
jgi:hypothetical protein